MLVVHHFKARSILQALVTAYNDINAIQSTESLGDVPAKLHSRCSSGRAVHSKKVRPTIIVWDRIGPQNVVEPSVAFLVELVSIQRSLHTCQLINCPFPITNATMHGEDLTFNEASKWKPLEGLGTQQQKMPVLNTASFRFLTQEIGHSLKLRST